MFGQHDWRRSFFCSVANFWSLEPLRGDPDVERLRNSWRLESALCELKDQTTILTFSSLRVERTVRRVQILEHEMSMEDWYFASVVVAELLDAPNTSVWYLPEIDLADYR